MRIGEDWDDKDWIAKAKEVVKTLQARGRSDELLDPMLRKRPVLEPEIPRPPPEVPPLVLDEPAGTAKMQLDGREVCIVKAIEQAGFAVLPAWHSAVDKIHEVTDMPLVRTEAEAMHTDSIMLGMVHGQQTSIEAKRSKVRSVSPSRRGGSRGVTVVKG